MLTYYGNRKSVAQFVREVLLRFESDSLSITITRQEKSEVFSVSIATDTSSEGTVKQLAQIYSVALLSTLPPNTQGG